LHPLCLIILTIDLQSNKDLIEQLRIAEETKQDLAAKSITAASEAAEHEDQMSTLRANLEALKTVS
jgi:hypothetical protein